MDIRAVQTVLGYSRLMLATRVSTGRLNAFQRLSSGSQWARDPEYRSVVASFAGYAQGCQRSRKERGRPVRKTRARGAETGAAARMVDGALEGARYRRPSRTTNSANGGWSNADVGSPLFGLSKCRPGPTSF